MCNIDGENNIYQGDTMIQILSYDALVGLILHLLLLYCGMFLIVYSGRKPIFVVPMLCLVTASIGLTFIKLEPYFWLFMEKL